MTQEKIDIIKKISTKMLKDIRKKKQISKNYKKYYEKNKSKLREKHKEYYEKNKDLMNENMRKYHKENKRREKRKEYYEKNKSKLREKCKEYYEKNKDLINEKAKEYIKNNKEYYKEYRAKYRKEYRKTLRNTNPLYKLSCNIRNSIVSSLSKLGYKKKSRTQEILGCSFEEFKRYIESQFQPWMSWDNRGNNSCTEINMTWDLDHIIPISSAKTEEEVLKLNHYTNFQPLCSYINRYIKRDINL